MKTMKNLLIISGIILIIFSIIVFADTSIREYNPITKTLKLTNGSFKLDTPQHNYIFPKQHFAEIEVNLSTSDELFKVFNKIDFYNKIGTSLGNKINTLNYEFSYYNENYKYNITLPIFIKNCSIDTKTMNETCKRIQNGTKIIQYTGNWLPLTLGTKIPLNTKIRIYYPEAIEGRTYEWIPTIYKNEISEWADFTTLIKFSWYNETEDEELNVWKNRSMAQMFRVGNNNGINETFFVQGISLLAYRNNTAGLSKDNISIYIYSANNITNKTADLKAFAVNISLNNFPAGSNYLSCRWINISFNQSGLLTKGSYYGIYINGTSKNNSREWHICRNQSGGAGDYIGSWALLQNSSIVAGDLEGASWKPVSRSASFALYGTLNPSPTINIIYPANSTYAKNISVINYTRTDATGLTGCWYSFDKGHTNSTKSATCANFSIDNEKRQEGGRLLIVYANNTLNNINSSNVSFYQDSIKPLISINTPAVAITSLSFLVNITATDEKVVSSCWFNITEAIGGAVEVTNRRIADCKNYSTAVSSAGTYVLHTSINDSVGNYNYTNRTFSVTILGGGGGGGGGGTPILSVITTPPQPAELCIPLRETLLNAWNTFKNSRNYDNFKALFTAFYTSWFCDGASSIVPL